MESTIITKHKKLKVQRLTDKKTSFIVKYMSYLSIGFLFFVSIMLACYFVDIIDNSGEKYQSIGIISSVVLFIDLVFKILLYKPKISYLYPYLILPISKKRIIRESIIAIILDVRHYLSLFCFIIIAITLYCKGIIDISFVANYLMVATAIVMINSLLTLLIKNFNLFITIVTVLVCLVYFFTLLLIAKGNWYPKLFWNITSNLCSSILILLISSIFYIFVIKKILINYIYGNNQNHIKQQLAWSELLFQKTTEIHFVLKLFLRGQPCSIWYIMGLLTVPFMVQNFNSQSISYKCLFILLGSSILTRFINIHKLVSYYSDGLITLNSRYFKNLLSGLYTINIVYSTFWCIMIYCFSQNIFYPLSCFFLSLGIGPLMNFLYTVYDPGKYSIYCPMFNGQEIQYHLTSVKANIIFFVFFIATFILCSFIYNYLSPETATSIIAAQGFIFFFTKKFWLNKLNDIYMKNRYENLAKCRGEKFYK